MARRKRPWRLSPPQKARQRARLRHVDNVVAILDRALTKNGAQAQAVNAIEGSKSQQKKTKETGVATGQGTIKAIEQWKHTMPSEEEMLPKDKYTIFDRKERKYRKGIHSELTPWSSFSDRSREVDEYDGAMANGLNRTPQVDSSIAAPQPARLLGRFFLRHSRRPHYLHGWNSSLASNMAFCHLPRLPRKIESQPSTHVHCISISLKATEHELGT
jgi:hypothetical protein